MAEEIHDDAQEQDGLNETSTRKKDKTKTPMLDNFGKDLTKMAKDGKLESVIGREQEIDRVIQILSRKKKNNPVLIGEPGVGKCIVADTQVVMRNDLSGETFNVSVKELLNTLSYTKKENH